MIATRKETMTYSCEKMVKENLFFQMTYVSFNFLSLLVQFSPKNEWSQLQVPSIVQIPLSLHVVAGSQNTMNRRNDSFYQSIFQQSHCELSLLVQHSQIMNRQNFIRNHHLIEDSKHFWELT